MKAKMPVLVACAWLCLPVAVHAGNACAVGFKPETSGFALNPILDKLTVTSAKPRSPSDTCMLAVGDEILQVNAQKVPGARALAVRKYWKSLASDAPVTFRVKRGGAILSVTSR